MTTVPAADPQAAAVQQVMLAAEPAPPGHPGYGLHVGVTHLLPGASTALLRHDVAEFVLVRDGALDAELDGRVERVRTGDYFTIPAGCWHGFANPLPVPASMLFAFGGEPERVTTRHERQTARPRPQAARLVVGVACDQRVCRERNRV